MQITHDVATKDSPQEEFRLRKHPGQEFKEYAQIGRFDNAVFFEKTDFGPVWFFLRNGFPGEIFNVVFFLKSPSILIFTRSKIKVLVTSRCH